MTKLNKVSTISTGDSVVIMSAADDEFRAISITDFMDYVNDNLTSAALPTLQYEAPNATAFEITAPAKNTWIVMTPLAAYAAGTIKLPVTPTELTKVIVTTTQTVTSLAFDGQGANTPTASTLTAGVPLTLAYEPVLNTWYRVG